MKNSGKQTPKKAADAGTLHKTHRHVGRQQRCCCLRPTPAAGGRARTHKIDGAHAGGEHALQGVQQLLAALGARDTPRGEEHHRHVAAHVRWRARRRAHLCQDSRVRTLELQALTAQWARLVTWTYNFATDPLITGQTPVGPFRLTFLTRYLCNDISESTHAPHAEQRAAARCAQATSHGPPPSPKRRGRAGTVYAALARQTPGPPPRLPPCPRPAHPVTW